MKVFVNDDLNEWNPRNELRLPLKLTTTIQNIDLDCSTPRFKAAMKNILTEAQYENWNQIQAHKKRMAFHRSKKRNGKNKDVKNQRHKNQRQPSNRG